MPVTGRRAKIQQENAILNGVISKRKKMTNNKYKRDLFQTAGNNMLKQSTSKGDFCVGSSDNVFRLF